MKLPKSIELILPGIFLIGYNVGTGSVTSMSKAGANFGLDLLWTVFVSCLITYYLIILVSKYTMVTGKTIIQGIKDHIHPGLAIVLIIALSLIIVGALMAVIGLLSEVLFEWSKTIVTDGIPEIVWALLIAGGLYILLWIGNFPIFEKVLAILVSIMGAAFIATMFINFPSLSELASGLVPKIPEVAEGSDNGPLIILSGMVGTTVSVFVFIIRSQIVKETGWKMADNALQKRDALISATMMFVISAAIMITAATTLHVNGLKMNNIVELVQLLEPLAGKAALGIFVIGIVAAGISSHLPNILVIPWLMFDYQKKGSNTKNSLSRIILFVLSIFSVLGVSFGFNPVVVMMLSQASIAIVLPITIASIFYLTSRKEFMNQYVIKFYDYIILITILIFSIYMSSIGIRGLIVDLKSIF